MMDFTAFDTRGESILRVEQLLGNQEETSMKMISPSDHTLMRFKLTFNCWVETYYFDCSNTQCNFFQIYSTQYLEVFG